MTHLSQNKLAEKLKEAEAKISVGGHYAHYKDSSKSYTVLLLAISEKDNRLIVVYQADYGQKIIFTRPISEWLDVVEKNDKKKRRFSLI